MATRKLKVISVQQHPTNTDTLELKFSRPLNSLEVEGFKARVQGKYLAEGNDG